MAAKVGQRPAAEIPLFVPARALVDVVGMVRTLRRRPQPQVPVQVIRNRDGLFGPIAVTPNPRRPDVNFADRPNGTGLDAFDHAPAVPVSVRLGTHLSSDLCLVSFASQEASFPNGMGKRLFAIDMLFQFECGQNGKSVSMVWGAHHHGVDVLAVVVQFAEIEILSRFRVTLSCSVEISFVNVAQSHDVFAADFFQIVCAASANADDGQVELFVGGPLPGGTLRRSVPAQRQRRGGNCCAQKLAASKRMLPEEISDHTPISTLWIGLKQDVYSKASFSP